MINNFTLYDPLPIEVLHSGAGFYLGRCCPKEGPISRLSIEYWNTKEEAEEALSSDNWTMRFEP